SGDAGAPGGQAGLTGAAGAAATGPCVWSGFAGQGTYGTGSGPDSIVVADLDRDGRLDLATSNWGGARGSDDGSVSVLLANGPGTFAAQTMYETEIQPNDLAVGDLTGDGLPEIVVAGGLDTLNVLHNAGGGAFAPRPGVHLSEPLAVTVADLDGDGRADVAASMGSDAVDIFLGKGDGTLVPTGQYVTGDMTYGLAAADLDGDGRLDLVATNVSYPPGVGLPVSLGEGRVAVFINQGGGKFADEVRYQAGNGTDALAVADLDGDGRPDVAVANDFDGTVGVFHNRGDGTFDSQAAYEVGATTSTAQGGGMAGVVAADFDGDGHVDLVTTRTLDDDTTVVLLRNAGDGTFAPPAAVPGPARPEAIASGDFDGDGRPDLAITGDATVTIMLAQCR
ncbi:MAG TPA: VCBS repeat-containing protein, partial [Polyangia bacterium]|nr:VCBS repeat-containing protein [Polyangia bacterium]